MDAATDWVVSGGAGALDFDGSDDLIAYSQVAPKLVDRFCICGWLKSNDINQANNYVISSNIANTNNNWSVIYGYLTKSLEFFSGSYSGTNPRNNSQILINDTDWHFFAYNYNSVTWSVWQDRDLISSVSQSFSITQDSIGFALGNYGSGATFYGLHGQLDDIRIYNRALTEPEIRLLASKRGIGLQPRPKQFTYYQFPSGSKRRRILTGMT
jgi:hypothetical protein